MEIKDFIGTKYAIHGRTLEEGLDCYGVVILYYKEILGITLLDPFYTGISNTEKDSVGKILEESLPLEQIKYPEKHCIIGMQSGGKLSHIAVYLGDGMILHSTKSTGCIVSNINVYSNMIVGYYKIKE